MSGAAAVVVKTRKRWGDSDSDSDDEDMLASPAPKPIAAQPASPINSVTSSNGDCLAANVASPAATTPKRVQQETPKSATNTTTKREQPPKSSTGTPPARQRDRSASGHDERRVFWGERGRREHGHSGGRNAAHRTDGRSPEAKSHDRRAPTHGKSHERQGRVDAPHQARWQEKERPRPSPKQHQQAPAKSSPATAPVASRASRKPTSDAPAPAVKVERSEPSSVIDMQVMEGGFVLEELDLSDGEQSGSDKPKPHNKDRRRKRGASRQSNNTPEPRR